LVSLSLTYSEGLLGVNHGLNTVVHVLDEVLLGSAESSLVGDVVGGIGGFRVLTVDTADLDVVLVSDSLEGGPVLGELGELDVDGGTHGGSEVGGAGGDVTEVLVVGELDNLLDLSGTAGKAVEDGVDVGTGLHGDDTELILFVNPDKEGLVVVVEDTTTVGPVTVKTASLEETISLSKKWRLTFITRF
jgi:hypothetical protein